MKQFYQIGYSLIICVLLGSSCSSTITEDKIQDQDATVVFDTLSKDIAMQISRMPIHCILQEYPNKTGHTAANKEDILKTPQQLHPSFYGCFDWHSSVHGHWSLVRVLNRFPTIENKDSIVALLQTTLTKENIEIEAAYFDNNILGQSFERTYGWAWLLKLDEELAKATLPELQVLHAHLQPLTNKIVDLWKVYLPKQSYPNRTGVHNNTAFGLRLAWDWASFNKEEAFLLAIKQKALAFYGNNKAIPAHLEPDGSDFFSPSLYVADLMSQLLPQDSFNVWINLYFTDDGVATLCQLPQVSDRNDYQIVHLDGLMFSRTLNMRTLLPKITNPKWKQQFQKAQEQLLSTGLQHLNESNYGGEHWLGSFAVLALSGY